MSSPGLTALPTQKADFKGRNFFKYNQPPTIYQEMVQPVHLHFTNHLTLLVAGGSREKFIFNPITDGGGVQHPPYRKSALRPSKWPPNDPKFRDFSYFYMTYLKSKKKFFGFSQ